MRVFRRPKAGVFDRHGDLPSAGKAGGMHHLAPVANGHFQRASGEQRRRDGLDGDRPGVHIRGDFQARDMDGMNRLQPHRLPDAAGGGVPDATRLAHLLADGLCAGVGGVPDRHDQLILAVGPDIIRDIETKGVIAAAVVAHLPAIDQHGRVEIHRAEMEQDAPPLPLGRQRKGAPIPEAVVFTDRAADTGQGRFDRERHQDALLEVGPRRHLAGDRQVPEAVEVEPVFPHHLRPRIFGVNLVG